MVPHRMSSQFAEHAPADEADANAERYPVPEELAPCGLVCGLDACLGPKARAFGTDWICFERPHDLHVVGFVECCELVRWNGAERDVARPRPRRRAHHDRAAR